MPLIPVFQLMGRSQVIERSMLQTVPFTLTTPFILIVGSRRYPFTPPIGLIVGSEEFLFPTLGLFLTFMSTNGQMDQDMLRELLMTGGIEDTGRRTAVNRLPSVAGTQGVTLRRLRGFQIFDGSVVTSFPPGPVTYYYNQHERAYEGIRSDDVHPSNCIEVNQSLHDGIRAGLPDPSVERQRYMLLPNERSIDQPIIIEEMPVESCIGKTCSTSPFFYNIPILPQRLHSFT